MKELSPKSEFYLFIPRDEELLETYSKFIKITDIFIHNSVGIVTSRDNFVIDNDKNSLLNRIRLFKNSNLSDEELHEFFSIRKNRFWNIREAWNSLQSISDSELNNYIQPVLYRPFDKRYIFYHDALIERCRKEVMCHMMRENVGLITRRQMLHGHPCNYVFVSKYIISDGVIRSDNKGGESLFPLYLYHCGDESIFNKDSSLERNPNIKPDILSTLTEAYGESPTAESIFYYNYAVLYSNIYRTKYAEFLRIDFPRIPFTKDYETFKKIAELGERLVKLHLLTSPELDPPVAKFQGEGDNKVEKVRYENGRVYINKTQYFEGVEPQVWQYQTGGYQVCDKWLKDRKERILSLEDIKHYCKIVTSLKKNH